MIIKPGRSAPAGRPGICGGAQADDNPVQIGTGPQAGGGAHVDSPGQPDVITMDVEMPGQSGIDFLKQYLPTHPIPVILDILVNPGGMCWTMTMGGMSAGSRFMTENVSNVLLRHLKTLG